MEKTELVDEEKKYFDKCVQSFRFYRKHAMLYLRKNITDYKALPARHQQMLSNYMSQQHDVRICIEKNYMFILHLLDDVDSMFSPDQDISDKQSGDDDDGVDDDSGITGEGLSQGDLDRVYTTIRQFVRDWSAEGRAERDKCYKPLVDAVQARYPDSHDVSVLVPGAGLGRLAFEFASLGYNSEGNEFSIFMLIGSNFVLNKTEARQFDIYPWSTTTTNNMSHTERVAPVYVPDIDTLHIPEGAVFGMCAGDFTEVYTKDTNRFNVVAASFFLDTAHNIIDYLEIIYSILKPGGHLVSLGPLLYHYAGMQNQPSIEVPWDDVLSLIGQVGFVIEEVRDVENVPYIGQASSMLNVLYRCKFLVARKPS